MRTLLLISAALMIVGHIHILSSGTVFNPKTGQRYNVVTHYVSDFAAKLPEGLWIKASIMVFCIALALLFHEQILQVDTIWKKNTLRILGGGMIAGLLLVILFDCSPQEYEFRGANWCKRLFGDKGRWVEVPRSSWYPIILANHNLGFYTFIACFFASVTAFILFSPQQQNPLGIIILLIVAAVMACWTLFLAQGAPGIPQRAFLVLVFAWAWDKSGKIL